MPDDDEVTQEWRPLKPWTPVHSARGKFTHMSHNGRDTLCGVRLRTLVVSEDEINCQACHQALTFN